eukprot:7287039-Pyramimonas_sp.AAC.1
MACPRRGDNANRNARSKTPTLTSGQRCSWLTILERPMEFRSRKHIWNHKFGFPGAWEREQ